MAARAAIPPRVLWVEGKNDSAVVQSLCLHHDVPRDLFKVDERTGVDVILDGLGVALRARGRERFGIVVDANGDVGRRWAAIRDVLRREGYPDVPDHPEPDGMVLSGPELPRFGVWIMPDNRAAGMLEDFAAALVPEGDFLWDHAGAVVDGIPPQHRRFRDAHRSKARIRTWLAWQEEPGAPMGQAITKRYLDGDAPAGRRFVAWLRRLMADDLPGADRG